MCSDNETTQDLLGYQVHADLLKKIMDFIAKGTEVIQVSEVAKGTVDFRPSWYRVHSPGISHAFAVIDYGAQVTFTGFSQLVDDFEDVIHQDAVRHDGFAVAR